jgi:hypothetical protein
MNPVLSSIFYHYERQIKWLTTNHADLTVGQCELSLGQEMTQHGIFNQLKLYEHAGVYGCSRTWMFCVVCVSILPYFLCFPMAIIVPACFQEVDDPTAECFFGIKHTLKGLCSAGHSSLSVAAKPEMVYTIIANAVDATHVICEANVTLQGHLEHLTPRCSIGNDESGTTLLHTILDLPCSHPGCKNHSSLSHIQTSWPNILCILPETIGSSKDSLNGEPLTIPLFFSIQKDVKYELVGRICYECSKEHFTCDCIISD